MTGGYDDGYRACDCFWGREPGSLVVALQSNLPSITGLRVLDLGCGEGKNAAYLAKSGAIVDAIDVSPYAIANARTAWPGLSSISWTVADVRTTEIVERYDVVIAYGLLHCLKDRTEIMTVTRKIQQATRDRGWNVVCTFNDRAQDLSAHPGFQPCLLPHAEYVQLYSAWDIVEATDTDLQEVHPHNQVQHTHSLTRLLARRRS